MQPETALKKEKEEQSMNEKYLNVLNALRPIDDTFMRMIFKDYQCVELLLKIIFGEQFSLKRFKTQEGHK